MTGEGGAGLAVDEEAYLGDGGDVGVEGLDDGEKSEGFRFDAGGLRLREGCVEIDDGELMAGLAGDGQEEDAVDVGGWLAGGGVDKVGRVGSAPGGDELMDEGSGTGGFVLWEGQGLRDGIELAGFVVGHEENCGDEGFVRSLRDRNAAGERSFQTRVGLATEMDEKGSHGGAGEDHEQEDGLAEARGPVAKGHGWRLQSCCHWRMPATMAFRTAD